MELATLIALGLHALLSVFNQFSYFQDRLARFNRTSIIPYWSFFAPVPGTSDNRVVIRKKDSNNQVTDWSEVNIYETRSVAHLFWNPNKHRQKCVFDCVSLLLREIIANPEVSDETFQLSWSYIKLAQLSLSEYPCMPGETLQFAVVASEGLEVRKLRPLIVSRWHGSRA